ncbi:hypothetical protein JQ625_30340 [Bradyrhizobium diazoefficiens]|nr:hypothetical protein [Bradyrhizobium diazoefficiens]MBR0779142.1 hypothetical protein [Bradyrhizobium diazoefficiens]
MARKSDNFPLVLGGGTLALALAFHTIWTIVFEDWVKHQLERLVGHTVAEMIEKFGDVGFSVIAAIAVVWFLYWYIKRALEAELKSEAAEPIQAPANLIFDSSLVKDATLLEAIWRVTLGKWGERREYAEKDLEAMKPFWNATIEIRQRAFEGKLPIWAKRRGRPNSTLFEIVPPQFWLNHEINEAYCRKSPDDVWVHVTHPLVVGEVPHARTNVWTDFVTSRAAIEKLWPGSPLAQHPPAPAS